MEWTRNIEPWKAVSCAWITNTIPQKQRHVIHSKLTRCSYGDGLFDERKTFSVDPISKGSRTTTSPERVVGTKVIVNGATVCRSRLSKRFHLGQYASSSQIVGSEGIEFTPCLPGFYPDDSAWLTG